MMKVKLFVSFLFCLLLFMSSHPALADIGPKPTMEFEFDLPNDVTIASGIQYECDQADCSDAAPLEELGPQRLYCETERCSAIAYGFAPYHRLEIQFSDGKTLQSNVFETIDFNSNYLVTVNADGLLVEEVSGSPAPPEEPFPDAPGTRLPLYVGIGILVLFAIGAFLLLGLAVFFIRRSRKN